MATTNVSVGRNWVKVADIADTDLLITWVTPAFLEVATTATDVAPNVIGHQLSREEAISRSVIGQGYVWVKVVGSGPINEVPLVISK